MALHGASYHSLYDMMKVDNDAPLSSGQHYSGADGANWSYTKSITSGAYFHELSAGQYYAECQSGLMKSLSSINSNIYYNDELIAVMSDPSTVYYIPETLASQLKKADGYNLEWLLREHQASYMTISPQGAISFDTPLSSVPMLNDIRTVSIRIDVQGRFSDDTGYYDYSDFGRKKWIPISTNEGLDFRLDSHKSRA